MPNATFANLPTTIFEEMSGLARSLGAINLGQGFPDDPGPQAVRAKAADLVLNGYNQYPPMPGLPELRAAVAGHYAAPRASTSTGRARSPSPPARRRRWRSASWG
jgi:aspartate/methionine/tyrosine aminotransferase